LGFVEFDDARCRCAALRLPQIALGLLPATHGVQKDKLMQVRSGFTLERATSPYYGLVFWLFGVKVL
jgi:hypothetical protein